MFQYKGLIKSVTKSLYKKNDPFIHVYIHESQAKYLSRDNLAYSF